MARQVLAQPVEQGLAHPIRRRPQAIYIRELEYAATPVPRIDTNRIEFFLLCQIKLTGENETAFYYGDSEANTYLAFASPTITLTKFSGLSRRLNASLICAVVTFATLAL